MGHWQAVLCGADAERAKLIAGGIAREVTELSPMEAGGASVSTGRAGAALLHAYLAKHDPASLHADHAARELDAAMANLDELAALPALHGGFSGVAWAVEHLADVVADIDEDSCAEIDDAVLAWVRDPDVDFDLISGLTGAGTYALERLPHPNAGACLEEVIARLAATAEVHDDGLAWRTPSSGLPRVLRRDYRDGYFNLGLAHGMPGVIAFLARAYRAGLARPTVTSLLERAVPWLLRRERPRESPSRFARWIHPRDGDQGHDCRLGWCYGDAGVAISVLAAARAVGNPDWESRAVAIARHAATRPHDTCGIADAGLCHGTAGIAHVLGRIWNVTRDPMIHEVAVSWFRRTLDMHVPGTGIGGYLSLLPSSAAPVDANEGRASYSMQRDAGLLTGSTGIALALLGACSTVEPSWDRLLLVSVDGVGHVSSEST